MSVEGIAPECECRTWASREAMKDAREDCAAAGMDDYLVKPLEIQALKNTWCQTIR